MIYDIELGQGDSDNVGVVLKENGAGANLTGSTVLFAMKNDLGSVEHLITCTPGAVINGVSVPLSEGGVTIPFTDVHTGTPGTFFGNFPVTILGKQTTFPSDGVYINIRIHEAI